MLQLLGRQRHDERLAGLFLYPFFVYPSDFAYRFNVVCGHDLPDVFARSATLQFNFDAAAIENPSFFQHRVV
jgi:hypothetical protein